MDLDALFVRYFGTADLDAADAEMIAGGLERLRVDFGMETDRGRRFGLWAVMHMLGIAPDLDVAFADPADRDAARSLMDLADRTAS
ncbi:MAG: hypothetical protein V4537_07925 [Pseudomonadota bacterium]